MASTIGIKLANGEFYSIVEENSDNKKRMVLTTVHDTQGSMQIDLYKSATRTMADAVYIGSIVVENIKKIPKGEPSVELVISSNADGEISVDAVDLDASSDNPEPYHLSVSLKSMEEEDREPELSDFELDFHESPPAGLYEKSAFNEKKERHKSFILIAVVATILLMGFCLWFLFFRNQDEQIAKEKAGSTTQVQAQSPSAPESPASQPEPEAAAVPEPPASQSEPEAAESPASTPEAATAADPASQPEPETAAAPEPTASTQEPATAGVPDPSASTPKPAAVAAPEPPASKLESAPRRTEAPVIEAPPPASKNLSDSPRRARRNPPVASYNVPTTIPRGGHPYRIRWGDTLWDISEAFYRNPWLYPRIARFNSIRNPDFILSGRTIRIPPKN
jgi:nucleoid-associated protein YgaU